MVKTTKTAIVKKATKRVQSKVKSDGVLCIALGGTIDKDYPKLLKGYAFEFGEPAMPRILTLRFWLMLPQVSNTQSRALSRKTLNS